MTRDEAIKILSTRDAHGVLCGYTSGVTEAIDMAISALSADGDLISRADAIEAVMKYAKENKANADKLSHEQHSDVFDKEITEYRSRAFGYANSADIINALPSAEAVHKPDYSYEADMVKRLRQAEAVQGEWKRVETRTYKGECTNCGFRHIFMDGHDSQYRYCPKCGARMYKGGEDE